jgi:SAM-dependent methyltransferase
MRTRGCHPLVERLRRDALPGAEIDERDLRAHAPRCERLVAALARSLPPVGHPRVLEVGLGAGYVVAAVRSRLADAVDLYAVEHPARALPHDPRFGSYLATHALAYEPADLVGGPLTAFPGVSFEAIVCSEVIEHLPPDALPAVLEHLAGRLAPDGVLVLSSPNLRSFHRRASFALGGGRIFDLPFPLAEAGGTYGHVRLYARSEIEDLLAHAGLEVVSWEYVDFETPFIERRLLGTLQALLARAVPSLSSGWISVARQRLRSRS